MEHQRKLFEICRRELAAGRPVVRAVILRTWGSTPREVGADMVMDVSGGLFGTVGGGCGEAEVYDLGQELLRGAPAMPAAILHVDLTEDPDEGGGKVCGGRLDVLVQRLDPDRHGALMEELVKSLERGDAGVLRTDLHEARPGFWKEGRTRLELDPTFELGDQARTEFELQVSPERCLFLEPLGMTRTLVIVGAGHIARPLCRMAATVGYLVTVLDDRPEYADAEFFPDAHTVLAGDYQEMLPPLTEEGLVSVVLVTRGHKHDQDCLRLIVDRPLEYLGMIGSARRIEAVFAELLEEGVAKDDLRRVCAPIGLDIGARTPQEIAVSILAQMIQNRRSGGAVSRLAAPRRRRIKGLAD